MLASLSSQYEPARELIILKLKNVLMIKLTEQDSSFELFHSLSRGSKVLKNILLEESLIVMKLKQRMATSEVAMKVIANLSIDRKIFMDVLPAIKQLSIQGNLNATFCIKNLGYNLEVWDSYIKHVDYNYVMGLLRNKAK